MQFWDRAWTKPRSIILTCLTTFQPRPQSLPRTRAFWFLRSFLLLGSFCFLLQSIVCQSVLSFHSPRHSHQPRSPQLAATSPTHRSRQLTVTTHVLHKRVLDSSDLDDPLDTDSQSTPKAVDHPGHPFQNTAFVDPALGPALSSNTSLSELTQQQRTPNGHRNTLNDSSPQLKDVSENQSQELGNPKTLQNHVAKLASSPPLVTSSGSRSIRTNTSSSTSSQAGSTQSVSLNSGDGKKSASGSVYLPATHFPSPSPSGSLPASLSNEALQKNTTQTPVNPSAQPSSPGLTPSSEVVVNDPLSHSSQHPENGNLQSEYAKPTRNSLGVSSSSVSPLEEARGHRNVTRQLAVSHGVDAGSNAALPSKNPSGQRSYTSDNPSAQYPSPHLASAPSSATPLRDALRDTNITWLAQPDQLQSQSVQPAPSRQTATVSNLAWPRQNSSEINNTQFNAPSGQDSSTSSPSTPLREALRDRNVTWLSQPARLQSPGAQPVPAHEALTGSSFSLPWKNSYEQSGSQTSNPSDQASPSSSSSPPLRDFLRNGNVTWLGQPARLQSQPVQSTPSTQVAAGSNFSLPWKNSSARDNSQTNNPSVQNTLPSSVPGPLREALNSANVSLLPSSVAPFRLSHSANSTGGLANGGKGASVDTPTATEWLPAAALKQNSSSFLVPTSDTRRKPTSSAPLGLVLNNTNTTFLPTTIPFRVSNAANSNLAHNDNPSSSTGGNVTEWLPGAVKPTASLWVPAAHNGQKLVSNNGNSSNLFNLTGDLIGNSTVPFSLSSSSSPNSHDRPALATTDLSSNTTTAWPSGNLSAALTHLSDSHSNLSFPVGNLSSISASFRLNSSQVSTLGSTATSDKQPHSSGGSSASAVTFTNLTLPTSLLNSSDNTVAVSHLNSTSATSLAGLPFRIPPGMNSSSSLDTFVNSSQSLLNGSTASPLNQSSGAFVASKPFGITPDRPSSLGGAGYSNATGGISANHSRNPLPQAPPAFVPSGALFTNPTASQQPNATPPSVEPAPSSSPSKASPPPAASFPSTLPRYIVPSNAPSAPPANSTLISVLFTDALNWPWLVTNSNASSQVLVFMPALIASSLEIPYEEVVVQSLQAYQPPNYDPKTQPGMLTVWLGYIPTQYVEALQAMIRDPQSRFYQSGDPLLNALAKTVDPSLPLTSYATKTPASQAAVGGASVDQGNTPPVDRGQKIAVIASVTTCGAAILAMGLVFAARHSRKKVLHRQDGPLNRLEGGFVDSIGPPMMTGFERRSAFFGSNDPLSHPPGGGNRSSGLLGTQFSSQLLPNLYHGMTDESAEGQSEHIRHEYGEARTTSMIGEPRPTSWWWRLSGSGDSAGVPRRGAERIAQEEGPSLTLERSRSAESGHHSAEGGGPGVAVRRSPPGHGSSNRRVRITRGADGSVSGIGRPVMKENSLFF